MTSKPLGHPDYPFKTLDSITADLDSLAVSDVIEALEKENMRTIRAILGRWLKEHTKKLAADLDELRLHTSALEAELKQAKDELLHQTSVAKHWMEKGRTNAAELLNRGKRIDKLVNAIKWALGGGSEFPYAGKKGQLLRQWRLELRKRAGL